MSFPFPYLYNSLILKDKGDYKGAQVEINEYINKGGKRTVEIEKIITDINNIGDFEKAVDLAPSIKPFRYTYLHEQQYRDRAKELLHTDARLQEILK